MGWFGWSQKGDGKHDRFTINGSGGNDSVRHVHSNDTRTGGTKTVSESRSSNGQKTGHTTVHGNGHTNKHGSHKK